jgi:hypothetical protein
LLAINCGEQSKTVGSRFKPNAKFSSHHQFLDKYRQTRHCSCTYLSDASHLRYTFTCNIIDAVGQKCKATDSHSSPEPGSEFRFLVAWLGRWLGEPKSTSLLQLEDVSSCESRDCVDVPIVIDKRLIDYHIGVPRTIRLNIPAEVAISATSIDMPQLPQDESPSAEVSAKVQAFPTIQAENAKKKKAAAKAAGIELQVVKRHKPVEDHWDDCGEDISSLGIPLEAFVLDEQLFSAEHPLCYFDNESDDEMPPMYPITDSEPEGH